MYCLKINETIEHTAFNNFHFESVKSQCLFYLFSIPGSWPESGVRVFLYKCFVLPRCVHRCTVAFTWLCTKCMWKHWSTGPKRREEAMTFIEGCRGTEGRHCALRTLLTHLTSPDGAEVLLKELLITAVIINRIGLCCILFQFNSGCVVWIALFSLGYETLFTQS